MKRRGFIAGFAGASVWPISAWAQERRERNRAIGVLLPLVPDDAFAKKYVGAFVSALQQAGWIDGRNARIEIRWAGPIASDIRRHAAELVALGPEVVLAYGSSTVGALLQNTRTVPIVFPVMGDPVAAGYVESLAKPGGNVTGFMMYEYSMASTDCALGTPIGLIGLRNGLRQKTSLRATRRAPTPLPKSTANRIGSRPNESRSSRRGSDHPPPPSRRAGMRAWAQTEQHGRAPRSAGVEFIERTKTKGPGVRLRK